MESAKLFDGRLDVAKQIPGSIVVIDYGTVIIRVVVFVTSPSNFINQFLLIVGQHFPVHAIDQRLQHVAPRPAGMRVQYLRDYHPLELVHVSPNG